MLCSKLALGSSKLALGSSKLALGSSKLALGSSKLAFGSIALVLRRERLMLNLPLLTQCMFLRCICPQAKIGESCCEKRPPTCHQRDYSGRTKIAVTLVNNYVAASQPCRTP